jgi:predicted metal-dependent phosphotriesterase family hydrolase
MPDAEVELVHRRAAGRGALGVGAVVDVEPVAEGRRAVRVHDRRRDA